jgi:sensor domain CHASE-containing protein
MGIFALSGLISYGIQKFTVMPSFQTLEAETAKKNAERVLQALKRELDQIEPSVSDWSYWTDTYEYIKGQYPEYPETNLDEGATLTGLQMNYLGMFDTSGKAVWTQCFDIEEEQLLELGELTGERLNSEHPLLVHASPARVARGLIDTPHGPLMVVAKPILHNDKKHPPAGTLMMGRFLDETAVARLKEQTQLALTITPMDGQAPSDWIGSAGKALTHSTVDLVESANLWQASSTLADRYGQPYLSIPVDTPRDITSRGASAVSASLWTLGATGFMLMTAMLFLMQRAVLHPITTLSGQALKIGANDCLDAPLDLNRNDEVGILARTLDEMINRLAEFRRKLLDQSYFSGVAEMASGVLHNIGNAITPVNVKLSALQSDLAAAPVAKMEQATAELASPDTPVERRGDLAKFIELAVTELAGLGKRSHEELGEVAQQLVHVQEILADQEKFSRSARVMETVDMAVVINNAAAGLSPEIKSAMDIDITSSVTENGAVVGSRAALQQVVINILVNAAESILLIDSGKGKATVQAAQEEVEGQPMVHLQFEDNGAVIQPEHLKRLFERGFSTKHQNGSGHGLGLHWCANTLKTLNGRINVESEGVGRGACLHRWLPSTQKSATDSKNNANA